MRFWAHCYRDEDGEIDDPIYYDTGYTIARTEQLSLDIVEKSSDNDVEMDDWDDDVGWRPREFLLVRMP